MLRVDITYICAFGTLLVGSCSMIMDVLLAGVGTTHYFPFFFQQALPMCSQVHQVICHGRAGKSHFHWLLHSAVRPPRLQELVDVPATRFVALHIWLGRQQNAAATCRQCHAHLCKEIRDIRQRKKGMPALYR